LHNINVANAPKAEDSESATGEPTALAIPASAILLFPTRKVLARNFYLYQLT